MAACKYATVKNCHNSFINLAHYVWKPVIWHVEIEESLFWLLNALLLQGNLDQERLKKQQELAAAAALYQQLQQQQLFQLINR